MGRRCDNDGSGGDGGVVVTPSLNSVQRERRKDERGVVLVFVVLIK